MALNRRSSAPDAVNLMLSVQNMIELIKEMEISEKARDSRNLPPLT
jgi:hypothetical protein